RRPTLITHRGLSGPAPMDVSGYVEAAGCGCTLRIDFVPDLSAEVLEAALIAAARTHGRRHVRHLLPAVLPERLRAALCERAGAAAVAVAELSRERRRALVSA